MKKLPIGVDNFQELVQGDYLFCDKTCMISEFLKKGEKVTLITRPRRWGKTLNMSMLQYFFASEVNGLSTSGLFDDLEIGKLNLTVGSINENEANGYCAIVRPYYEVMLYFYVLKVVILFGLFCIISILLIRSNFNGQVWRIAQDKKIDFNQLNKMMLVYL